MTQVNTIQNKAIAIIGMAAKLPEAEDYQQFWENIANGRESVRELPVSRQKLNPLFKSNKEYARFGYLEGIDLFDPIFFKTLPTAAKWIDPAQRLLLQVTNDAIEDAGYCREQWNEVKVGIFLSDCTPEYYKYLPDTELDTLAGNLPANLAGRIAYCNGFTGPALTVDTACSSALVALHLALESMQAGDCQIAIVGGASIKIDLPEKITSSIGVMSPTGKCRSFDANADGTVGGEGVIAIILKPLESALKDRDQIHAIIRGSAVNQDGARSNGLTAPSPIAQKEVIQAAWQNAGIDPQTISYIETHGTATRLGDPIEITGLTDAFADFTQETSFCPIGAVKANIGHLGNVSGLAGLIKTVLSLKHRQIAPMVNFSEPNPFIDFASAPVYVNRSLCEWNTPYPRRAGVSSFGLSGTNCHVILEEAPYREKTTDELSHLMVIAASTGANMHQKLTQLADNLHKQPNIELTDLSYTLLMGQKHYNSARIAWVVEDREELAKAVANSLQNQWSENAENEISLQPVFLIPDYHSSCADYYEDFCKLGFGQDELIAQCQQIINLAENPQAAYFTFAYALANVWIALGVKPLSIIGLGIGELVSAAISKRLSLEEALAKAATFEANPVINTEKLHQFITLQISKGRNLFLHFGSESLLQKEVQECIGERRDILLYNCYAKNKGRSLLKTLAELYMLGLNLDWQVITHGQRISFPLSTYHQESYWFDLTPINVTETTLHTSSQIYDNSQQDHSLENIREILANIWRERLGLEQIGLNEDFIELGGDSIRAMLLMKDIKDHFGINLDLSYLLQYGTIAALSEKIKEELVKTELVETKIGQIPLATPIHYENGIAQYTLSPSQKNLWLVHQLNPTEVAYNEPMALILKGSLQLESLKKALQTMVDRHASLRTYFTQIQGEPVQNVYDQLHVTLECKNITEVDLAYSQLSRLENTQARRDINSLEKLVHQETALPFDLTQAPLFRAKVIQLAEQEYLFIMVIHHIIFDGWSILVLMREICQLYEAYVHHEPNPLPALPLQYYDFAHWQNQLLQNGQLLKAEEYWLDKLAGELPILNLPTDYPRPTQKSYDGSSLVFQISKELSQGIIELSKEEGTTLFATMLAIFEILLYKYTQQEEFVIGTPSANRPDDSLWGLIGFFVNTFTLRHQLTGDDTIHTLLNRVKNDLLETYNYKDYPFTELVSKLNRKRDLSRAALFDIMYVFHNVGSIQTSAEKIVGNYGGIRFQDLARREIVSDYDLKLEFEEAADHFNGKIEYCTRLFTRETIERITEHLQQIMHEVLSNPNKRLREINILTTKEKTRLLTEFNATKAEFTDNQTVHKLFIEQVAKTPDQLAVICAKENLTYQQLYQQAQEVAYILKNKGIGSNQIVAIMVERSLEMLTGIYGILMAGGAYLPIDPTYPDERIDYMLKDSQTKLVLVNDHTAARLSNKLTPNIEQLNITTISTSLIDQAAISTEHLDSNPTDIAYVIYTSGSTGKPKGVLIEHRALINRLQWMQKEYSLTVDDTIMQKTSYTFDVSVWELFWWALYGAKVSLLKPGGEKEPHTILNNIEANQITTMHFVPSMLNAFLNYLETHPEERRKLRSVRQIFASGEALKKDTVTKFIHLLGAPFGIRLHNLYGPTEATIDVSYFDCSAEIKSEIVPIGRPISNTKLFVLDDNLQIQPIGIPGEICIAGVGLARGYLNRPDLTAEKFIFHSELGEKLYRTGDLGRILSDGNIEFLGRIDHQVKVRGYRIELGEIESVLIKHSAILEANIITKEDQGGNTSLIAYCVPCETSSIPSIPELRQHLLQYLPEYMIPAAFIMISEMPHLPNGKVDRKALAKLEMQTTTRNNYVEPRNDLEKTLAKIWAKVLNQSQVGIYDNFFELGGDSIKAIQMTNELGNIGIEVQMNEIIQNQTIDRLATQILSTGWQTHDTLQKNETQQKLVEGQVALTPIQHWFFDQAIQNPSHWNQSVLLNLQPEVQLSLLPRVFAKLLEHHDSLRCIYHDMTQTFFYHNLMLRQTFDIPHFDLANLSEKEQKQQLALLGENLKASIDLNKGPLIKACTFDLGQCGIRLLITIHHLVIDGVSWQILLEDFNFAYQQITAQKEVIFPRKSDSYKEWATKLLNYSENEKLLSEIPYWSEILRSAEEFTLPLEMNTVNLQNTYAKNQSVSVHLPADLTEALLTQSHNAYNTQINDLLLTALALTIRDWTGQKHVCVNLESHGRSLLTSKIKLGRTIGWFTTLYPVILNLSHDKLDTQIKIVKETLRNVPQDGIGYAILKYLTKVWNNEEFTPIQIIFNYLGQLDLTLANSIFTIANENTGSEQARENNRPCLLEVVAHVSNNIFQIHFHYNSDYFRSETIEALASAYIINLKSIIHFCTDEGVGYTPSDFALAGLTQESLDELSADMESLLEGN